MYCKNCGTQMDDQAVVCTQCGFAKGTGTSFCPNCGAQTAPGMTFCTNCGVGLTAAAYNVSGGEAKSKMVAGLLGIFLGGLGVHNFYLGYTTKGVIQLILQFVTCGVSGIWGFIEGIMILMGSIDRDANGNLLKD